MTRLNRVLNFILNPLGYLVVPGHRTSPYVTETVKLVSSGYAGSIDALTAQLPVKNDSKSILVLPNGRRMTVAEHRLEARHDITERFKYDPLEDITPTNIIPLKDKSND